MNKEDVWNEEINPDGISQELDNLDSAIFDRGYCCPTDDGVWYEVYASDEARGFMPEIDLEDEEQKSAFSVFDSLDISNYASDGQITFFEANGEEAGTLSELAMILE